MLNAEKYGNDIVAVGVMSGTSVDGLDIALCRFSRNNKEDKAAKTDSRENIKREDNINSEGNIDSKDKINLEENFNRENIINPEEGNDVSWQFEILKATTISYEGTEWPRRLLEADRLNGRELMELHRDFGRFTGESVNRFLENTDKKVDFIAAHGHTVFHQPEQGLTLQIGDGAEITAVTGISSVSDFRRLDVALGGQGAPLVPAGDELLFGNYNYCLNLGGFANISFRKSGQRLAFDVCPVNIVINRLAQNFGQSFDKDGKIAEKGKVNRGLLDSLEKLDFYKLTGPRSLGKEWVDEVFFPVLDDSDCNTLDKLRTVYEHIARRIAAVILKPTIHGQVIDESRPGKQFSAAEIKNSRKEVTENKHIYKEQEEFIEMGHSGPASLLITGGGAKNGFLTKLISEKAAPVYMVIPEEELVDFKEAVVFAFLGLLRMRNEANCLSSVTGARHDNSGGIIHIA